MKLTGKLIDAAQVDVLISQKAIILWDAQLRGFFVRIGPNNLRHPNSKITFGVHKRQGGRGSRAIRVMFGSYPEMDVSAARDKALSLISAIRNGENPAKQKKDLLAQRRQEYVEFKAKKFKDIFERYRKERSDGSYYFEKEMVYSFNKYVLPVWGNSALTEITKADCKSLLKTIPTRPVARKIEAQLKPLFKWAMEQDIITANPFDGIKPQPKGPSRDRVLSKEELQAFWRATGDIINTDKPLFGYVFRLLLLTAARLKEIAHLGLDEIRLEDNLIVVAGQRVKNRKDHAIPLASLAFDILNTAPRRSNKLRFTYTHRPLSGFSISKRNVDRAMRKYLGEEFKPWRLHDFRRTFATVMAERGANPEIVDRCLGHVSKSQEGVRGVYQRYEFLKERAEVMQMWSDYLGKLFLTATN